MSKEPRLDFIVRRSFRLKVRDTQYSQFTNKVETAARDRESELEEDARILFGDTEIRDTD